MLLSKLHQVSFTGQKIFAFLIVVPGTVGTKTQEYPLSSITLGFLVGLFNSITILGQPLGDNVLYPQENSKFQVTISLPGSLLANCDSQVLTPSMSAHSSPVIKLYLICTRSLVRIFEVSICPVTFKYKKEANSLSGS